MIYKAEQLPIFQNRVYDTELEAKECPKGDVLLVQDPETGLIYNQNFNEKLMCYDVNYQNEQAVSLLFRTHLEEVSKILSLHFHNCSLIEVGCGKGFFLEYLQNQGFEIIGLDPTYQGTNPNIIKQYFSSQLDLQADCIILRHVLEHVQNPFDFLVEIMHSNGGKGKIYIEVPCFDWICRQHAWFDIFYEHVNYFRLSDFYRMFGKVHSSGHLFGEQYIYVVADLATLRKPVFDDSCHFIFPQKVLSSVSKYAKKIKKNIEQTSVIWGGASKGVIFAVFMQREGANVDFVVDINPAKQGKYLPAIGLKVSSPDAVIKKLDHLSTIFVMNSNYLNEIKQLTNNKFNYITVDHESI